MYIKTINSNQLLVRVSQLEPLVYGSGYETRTNKVETRTNKVETRTSKVETRTSKVINSNQL